MNVSKFKTLTLQKFIFKFTFLECKKKRNRIDFAFFVKSTPPIYQDT